MPTTSDIKRFLQQHRQAPLIDIAHHFDSEPDAVLRILEHWQRKGKVSRSVPLKCAGCNQCHSTMVEVFSWMN